jgi:glyoxylase-like metal-dependent hydrolase (beta-lactamase superfamily II)
MQIRELDEGMLLFQAAPPPGEIEGLNFLALVAGGEALFLDTGYAADMALALAELGRRGARPVGALISHYHPDHAGGLSLLHGVEVLAGARWRETGEAWLAPGERLPVEPTRVIETATRLDFGRHRLELIPLPGHSEDSLIILIDEGWLHAADSILFGERGQPLLPSVHARPVAKHLNAIDRLLGMTERDFIPGHGPVLGERASRERDLRNRRRYLAALVAAPEGIGFAEATAGCEPAFLGEAWHAENWR